MENTLEEFKKLHGFYAGGFDYQTKELAEYLGVSTRTIQRWMKGKTRPSKDQLKRIRAYLEKKRRARQKDLET